MKFSGKIIIVLGIAVILWASYQYISNRPTPIPEKPQGITEGVQALTDLYSNVFEKAEKQSTAKDAGAVGAILVLIGCGFVFIGRTEKKSEKID